MSIARCALNLVFILSSVGTATAAPAEAARLELGRVQWLELEDGPEGEGPRREVVVVPERDGELTVTVTSYDFDAALELLGPDGAVRGRAEDGLYETNPRMVVHAAAGNEVRLRVRGPRGTTGTFEVRVVAGDEPAPVGLELRIARTDFLAQSLEHALERGDERAAADLGLRLGEVLHASGRYAEARDVLDAAAARIEALGDDAARARCTMQLGRAAQALGRHGEARARYEEALDAFAALGAEEDVGRTLLNLGELDALAGRHDEALGHFADALGRAEDTGSDGLRSLALRRMGALLRERGELDRAEAALDEHLALTRRLGLPAEEARALGEIARLRADQGRHDEALALLFEELAAVRALGDGEAEAVTLGSIGKIQAETKRIEHAAEHFERALALARELDLPALEVTALHNLGTFHEDVQDVESAVARYEEALALARTLGMRDAERDLVLQLGSCAVLARDLPAILRRLGALDAIRAEAERAGEARAELRALRVLTRAERSLGRPDRALQHLERSEALRERAGWDEVELALERAWILFELGDADGAARGFETLLARITGSRAEPAATGNAAKLAVDEMQVLKGLGEIAKNRGEYARARESYARLVELATRAGAYGIEGAARRDLGAMCLQLGDADAALEQVMKALAIAEERGDAEEQFGAHYELGRVWTERRDIARARGHFEAARPFAPAPDADALALAALGYASLLEGDLEASAVQHEEALATARAIGFEALVPDLLAGLSRVELERGDVDAARAAAREALQAAEAQALRQPLYTLPAEHTLAVLAVDEGRLDEARERVRAARELLDELRLGAVRAGLDPGVGSAAEWLARFDRLLQDTVRAELRATGDGLAGAGLDEGFRRADAARGRSLLSGLVQLDRGARSAEAAARRAELEADIARWEALLEERRVALRAGAPASRTAELADRADALRTRIGTLERALARISPRDAALIGDAGAAADDVARTLDDDAALVLYADGRDDLYAYVLTRRPDGTADLAFVELAPRAAIADARDAWLAAIGQREALAGARQLARRGTELHRLLFAPIVERPELAGRAGHPGRTRITIVPTPDLAALPFESLVVEAADDPRSCADLVFALERWRIGYAPSASVLERLDERGPRRRDGGVLVLADPLYPAPGGSARQGRPVAAGMEADELLASNRALPSPERLERLANTRDEAFALAQPLVQRASPARMAELAALRGERSGTFDTAGLSLCVGGDASRARLFGGPLEAFAWIHLAAHGFIDRDAPRRSGLALAGSGDGGAYDGFLTIEDVLGMRIDANLVVLSACETARGKVRSGEGVESMATAFLYSGARGVVASLWQVDDRATAEIMQAFYSALLREDGGESPLDALAKAKLAIRSRNAATATDGPRDPLADPGHPFYWAAFVHIGLAR